MKDLKVIKYLVETLTNEGDLVLDCFMGSGTTVVACKNLGRDFTGIELNPEYFRIDEERIEKA